MQKSSSGSTVEVNEELIALFRYDEAVYAVLERCPHAGSNAYAVYFVCETRSATENAAPSIGTINCESLMLVIGCCIQCGFTPFCHFISFKRYEM